MALNFPNDPTDNQIFYDNSNGTEYIYDLQTNSWLVTTDFSDVGTVRSIDIDGNNGIVASGGPVTTIGTIDVSLTVPTLDYLPLSGPPPESEIYVLDCENILYGNQFSNQITRSLASKIRDTISINDFGVGDDATRITQALDIGGLVHIPKGQYTLNTSVVPTSNALFIDPAATFDNYSAILARGAFSDIDNGVNVWRLQDRVFVGGATSIAPSTTPLTDGFGIAATPIGLNSEYLERASALVSSSAYGGIGGLFSASQNLQYLRKGYGIWNSGEFVSIGTKRGYENKLYTSTTSGTTGGTPPTHITGTVNDGEVDWEFDDYTYMSTIALAAVVDSNFNDGTPSIALYTEGLRQVSGGITVSAEFVSKNQGDLIVNNPYNSKPEGSTIGLSLVSGGDATIAPSANPSTAALLIANDSDTWSSGIVFKAGSIESSEAIAFALNHKLVWYATDELVKANISSSRTAAMDDTSSIQFTNDGILIGIESTTSLEIAGTPTDDTWVKTTGGILEASVSVESTETDADLLLSAKGTGAVVIDSPLELGYATVETATTAGDFTADAYITVYKGGVPYYIPVRSTVW